MKGAGDAPSKTTTWVCLAIFGILCVICLLLGVSATRRHVSLTDGLHQNPRVNPEPILRRVSSVFSRRRCLIFFFATTEDNVFEYRRQVGNVTIVARRIEPVCQLVCAATVDACST